MTFSLKWGKGLLTVVEAALQEASTMMYSSSPTFGSHKSDHVDAFGAAFASVVAEIAQQRTQAPDKDVPATAKLDTRLTFAAPELPSTHGPHYILENKTTVMPPPESWRKCRN